MQSWHRRYCTMRKGQKDIQLPSYNELLGIDDFVNHEADQIVEVPLSEYPQLWRIKSGSGQTEGRGWL